MTHGSGGVRVPIAVSPYAPVRPGAHQVMSQVRPTARASLAGVDQPTAEWNRSLFLAHLTSRGDCPWKGAPVHPPTRWHPHGFQQGGLHGPWRCPVSVHTAFRRWGGRTAGLVVTGVGLYVVAPSLLVVFDAWPSLGD